MNMQLREIYCILIIVFHTYEKMELIHGLNLEMSTKETNINFSFLIDLSCLWIDFIYAKYFPQGK